MVGETVKKTWRYKKTQLVGGTVPVLCTWLESRDFNVVVIYTGARVCGGCPSGDVGEGGRGLAIPNLGSVELSGSAPADGHTGWSSKGNVLLERFIWVAGNSTRNVHACRLCET